MSSRKEDLVCPRCNSFIGRSDDLDCCPVCGKSLISNDGES